jgi:hypothetical protein
LNREARRRHGLKRNQVAQKISSESTQGSTGASFGLPSSDIYDSASSAGRNHTYTPTSNVRLLEDISDSSSADGTIPKPGQESLAGVLLWLFRTGSSVLLWFALLVVFTYFFFESLSAYRVAEGYAIQANDYRNIFLVALLPESSLFGIILFSGIPFLLQAVIRRIWKLSRKKKVQMVSLFVLLGAVLSIAIQFSIFRMFGVPNFIYNIF